MKTFKWGLIFSGLGFLFSFLCILAIGITAGYLGDQSSFTVLSGFYLFILITVILPFVHGNRFTRIFSVIVVVSIIALMTMTKLEFYGDYETILLALIIIPSVINWIKLFFIFRKRYDFKFSKAILSIAIIFCLITVSVFGYVHAHIYSAPGPFFFVDDTTNTHYKKCDGESILLNKEAMAIDGSPRMFCKGKLSY